jgi:membrane-bound lytic murein transglycosylase D
MIKAGGFYRCSRLISFVFIAICTFWGQQGNAKSRHHKKVPHSSFSLDETRVWAKEVQLAGDIDLRVDARVLKWVNHYLRTSAGRRFISKSLQRKSQVDGVILEKIDRLGLPRELIAIPLVESGYLDTKVRKDINSPVGIWQFEAQTARRLNLVVNSKVDERKHVSRATEAALRLLHRLHQRLGDWQLAIAAYNSGEKRVNSAIRKSGTRNPLVLAEKGYINDYVAKTTAAMLVLHKLNSVSLPES